MKYIESSNDIDLNVDDWYDIASRRIAEYTGKKAQIKENDGEMQYEPVNNNKSIEISNEYTRNEQSNSIYRGKQENINRPSTKTIHDRTSSLGQELDNSSFSLKRNKDMLKVTSDSLKVKSNQEIKTKTTKERKWSKTVTESDELDQELLKEVMKTKDYSYIPQSNKNNMT